jgi:tetratricopeptide (TPR) repeat protein
LTLPVLELRTAPGERTGSESEAPCALVGRERELERLRELVAAAVNGRGALAWVTGEPGAGKTALLERVRDELGALSPRAIAASGRCLELLDAPEDFSPLVQVTGEILRGPSREPMADALAAQCPHWCLYHPAEFAGRVSSEELRRAGTIDARALMRQLSDALYTFSAEAPLVLFLEDLQWTDRATADFLRIFAARLRRERVLVIGSFRAANAHTAPEALSSLSYRSQDCSELRLHLGPLAEKDVLALVERQLPEVGCHQRLARAVWKKSEGLPLFVARLLRDWGDRRRATDVPENVSDQAIDEALSRVPASVTGFIRQELVRLSEAERALLDAAAVIGCEFDTSTLAAALRAEEGEVEQQLDRLESARQLIVRLREEEPGDGQLTVAYRFCHALVQSELYALLPVQRRVELHRQVGAALLGRLRRKEQYSRCDYAYEPRAQTQLAFHLERGRNFAGAVVALLRAGDYCDRRFAKREAVSYYQRARELLQKTTREEQAFFRVLVAQSMGWARFGLGALELARSEFRTAAEGARELEEGPRSPAIQGVVEQGLGYLDVEWEDPSLRRPTAMIPDVAAHGVYALRAEAYFGECAALARAERYAELIEVAAELLEVGRRSGSVVRQTEGLAWLGTAQLEMGSLVRATATIEECLALSRALGSGRGSEMSTYARAVVHALQGELTAAAERFESLCGRTAVAHVVALCLVQLGDIYAKRGELARSLACHHEAVEVRRAGLGESAAAASGWIYRELGALREALELDLRALACCPDDEPQRRRFLSYSVATTHARLGDLASARRALDAVELPEGMGASLLNRQPEWEARCELSAAAARHAELTELAALWLRAAKAEHAREGALKAAVFLAESALEAGDRDGASAHLQAALDSYQTHPIPLVGLRIFRFWERLSLERGERAVAARARDAALASFEGIVSTIEDPTLRRSFCRSSAVPRSARVSPVFGT